MSFRRRASAAWRWRSGSRSRSPWPRGSPALADLGGLRASHVPAILAGVGLLLLAGIVDDVRGMRAMLKLCLQFAAAVVAWLLGLRIDDAPTSATVTVDLGLLLPAR